MAKSQTQSIVSMVLAVLGIAFAAAAIVARIALTRIGPEDYGTGILLIVGSIGSWLVGLSLSIVAVVVSRARGWLAWAGVAISLGLPAWTLIVLLQTMAVGGN